LEEMGEIVRGPGGEKLSQGDEAEGGMRALQFEVRGLEIERVETGQALAPQGGELVEQGGERLTSTAVAELRFPVDGIEGAGGAVAQDDVEARHPIDGFAVDEVADYGVGAPGGRAVGGGGPRLRETTEQRVEGVGSAGQDGEGLVQERCVHASIIGLGLG